MSWLLDWPVKNRTIHGLLRTGQFMTGRGFCLVFGLICRRWNRLHFTTYQFGVPSECSRQTGVSTKQMSCFSKSMPHNDIAFSWDTVSDYTCMFVFVCFLSFADPRRRFSPYLSLLPSLLMPSKTLSPVRHWRFISLLVFFLKLPFSLLLRLISA